LRPKKVRPRPAPTEKHCLESYTYRVSIEDEKESKKKKEDMHSTNKL